MRPKKWWDWSKLVHLSNLRDHWPSRWTNLDQVWVNSVYQISVHLWELGLGTGLGKPSHLPQTSGCSLSTPHPALEWAIFSSLTPHFQGGNSLQTYQPHLTDWPPPPSIPSPTPPDVLDCPPLSHFPLCPPSYTGFSMQLLALANICACHSWSAISQLKVKHMIIDQMQWRSKCTHSRNFEVFQVWIVLQTWIFS